MLTEGRNTPEVMEGRTLLLPVKGATKIFDGSLVALDANGFAVPGDNVAGLTAAGRAEEYVDNSAGADGAVKVRVRRGVFKWNNDANAPVTAKDVMKNCYILDDETVTATAVDTSVAGKVIGLEDDEVLVETI
jgi:hypothetical protein